MIEHQIEGALSVAFAGREISAALRDEAIERSVRAGILGVRLGSTAVLFAVERSASVMPPYIKRLGRMANALTRETSEQLQRRLQMNVAPEIANRIVENQNIEADLADLRPIPSRPQMPKRITNRHSFQQNSIDHLDPSSPQTGNFHHESSYISQLHIVLSAGREISPEDFAALERDVFLKGQFLGHAAMESASFNEFESALVAART